MQTSKSCRRKENILKHQQARIFLAGKSLSWLCVINMTKENIKIDIFEFKQGKTGTKYMKLNGTYTIFEEPVQKQIMGNLGQTLCFDVITNGTYKNIRELGTEQDTNFSAPQSQPQQVSTPQQANTPNIREIVREELKRAMEDLRLNSRVWGKGDDQLKVYFSTAVDLQEQIEELKTYHMLPACMIPPKEEPKVWPKKAVEEAQAVLDRE